MDQRHEARSASSSFLACASGSHGVAALVLLSIAGCDLPGRPDPADRPKTPEEVTQFTQLYARNCSGCHGADGTLGPAPPLNDPLFRGLIPEEELERVIRIGRPGTPMPAFAKANGGALTDAQVRILVKEIKGISYVRNDKEITPKWGNVNAPPKNAPAYLAGKDAGDKEHGRKLFANACAGCHGNEGHGGDLAGPLNDKAYLALISDQALRRIAITGRADLDMPDYADSEGRNDDFQTLTGQDVTDLVALLASWRAQNRAAVRLNPLPGSGLLHKDE